MKLKEVMRHYHNVTSGIDKTANRHMDKFDDLFKSLLKNSNLTLKKDFVIRETTYRTKKWDFSIWDGEELKVAIELKSIKGTGNFNNRIEEAVGSSQFIKRRYPSVKCGYLLVLEEAIPDRYVVRFQDFFNDCEGMKSYDATCLVRIVDNKGNFVERNGKTAERMMKILQKGL